MKISIIIPTINRPHELLSCLKSLFDSSKDNKDLILEILVIDQSKNFETKNLCSNFKVKYFHTEIKGLSKARNLGIKNSNGEYLLFLDDDIEVSKNYFFELHQMLSIYSQADAFTGKLINKNKTTSYSRYQNKESMWIDVASFHMVLSSGTGIKKSYYDDIGPFDERLGLGEFYGGSEEADFILRGLKKGKKIFFNENLISFHPEEKSSFFFSIDRLKRGFSYGKGRGALLKKNKDIIGQRIFVSNLIYPFLGALLNIFKLRFNLCSENVGSFFWENIWIYSLFLEVFL